MEIPFIDISTKSLLSLIMQFKVGKTDVLSNFFSLNDDIKFQYFETSTSIFIRMRDNGFYRLYIVTVDKNEAEKVLREFDSSYVINIPTKGLIDNWDTFLTKCGYRCSGVYSRYINTQLKYRDAFRFKYANIEDIKDIENLLLNNFSIHTDHIPSSEELMKMVCSNSIVADYDEEGRICGVMGITISGAKGYLNFWIDKGERGIDLLFHSYNLMIDAGVKYCYFWINDNNKGVIRLHQIFGAVSDGLKDYTFVKDQKKEGIESVNIRFCGGW